MLEDDKVTFQCRDRKDNNKIKPITLDAFEFIRRFLYHVLPDGFMKIRHYGILSNRNRKDKLLICKKLLGVEIKESKESEEKESWEDLLLRITGTDPKLCPSCKKGKMVLKEKLLPGRERDPP